MKNIPMMKTIKAAANETGLAQHFLRQLALSKKVSSVRAGKSKILLNMNSLDSYLNAGEQKEVEKFLF